MSDTPIIGAEEKPIIQCMNNGCGMKFQVEKPPTPIIDNQPVFSMVILIYKGLMICPNCGQRHTYMMPGKINYSLAVIPISEEQSLQGQLAGNSAQGQGQPSGGNGKIIIPPAGARIRRPL